MGGIEKGGGGVVWSELLLWIVVVVGQTVVEMKAEKRDVERQ